MSRLAEQLRSSYGGTRVLVTGDTGFKGGWLSLWLLELGAEVTGYGLPPDTRPSLFDAIGLSRVMNHINGDIRNLDALTSALAHSKPEVVFHLAAQPLVRRSYHDPLETFAVNVIGTATVLEGIRAVGHPCAIVIVTTDKCYENREWLWGYRETDRLGGHDPYSASKAAAEIVVESYRRSFFPARQLDRHGVALASARAGNVVGGGDWKEDRLIPDCIRALAEGSPVVIRNPESIRPWQYVLEPISGYLMLGAKLCSSGAADAERICGAFNFGPPPGEDHTVAQVTAAIIEQWGHGAWQPADSTHGPKETMILRLNTEKAVSTLSWRQRCSFDETIERTVEWYKRYYCGETSQDDLRTFSVGQIERYQARPDSAR